MGTQKLLLPWRGGTVIGSVLKTWLLSQVAEVVVVVRANDDDLIAACKLPGVTIFKADNPPDMKASVQCGLRYIRDNFSPGDGDAWLLAPADMPQLSDQLIDRLLVEFRATDRSILVPTAGGKRGHPAVFPWSLAADVFELGADEGVKSLLLRNPVRFVEIGSPTVLNDIDTPEDYQRLKNWHNL